MSESIQSIPNIFKTVRATSVNAGVEANAPASTLGSKWSLLASVKAKAWSISDKLGEEAKNLRLGEVLEAKSFSKQTVAPVASLPRVMVDSEEDLAVAQSAINRIFERRREERKLPEIKQPERTQPERTRESNIKQASVAATATAPVLDDSIIAVLARIEAAHTMSEKAKTESALGNKSRQPGFLSRLAR